MTSIPSAWIEVAAAVATLAGAFLFLASAIGLLRLPDFYSRVHSPTKAATLGIALLGIASLLRSLPRQDLVWIEDLLIVVFLFLTMPVSSQVLLRAAATRGIAQTSATHGEPAINQRLANKGTEPVLEKRP